MKRAVKLTVAAVLGVSLFAAGIWILARSLNDREPLHAGKPIDAWRQQLTNSDPAIACEASVMINTVIIPALTNRMFSDTNDPAFRVSMIETLNGLPGIHIDFVPADGRRAQAVQDAGSLGPMASPAVPSLLELLHRKDAFTMGAAAEALVHIHADPKVIVPALISCLVDEQGRGQGEIVDALAELKADARPAVPELIQLLKDRSSKDIMIAVPKALKAIDPEAAAKAGVK